MNITIRKCDVCNTDYRSDNEEYDKFSQLTDCTGRILDVCSNCVAVMYEMS